MGSGASTPAFAGCDADLVARASELAPKMPDDERIETLNEMLKEFNAEAAAFEEPDAEESYQVLKTTRDGSGTAWNDGSCFLSKSRLESTKSRSCRSW